MFKMVHNNINVINLEASLEFYEKALELTEVRRIEKPDFTIVYVGNSHSAHVLELTWLHDRTEPYDLGDNEIHLAFETDDIDAAHRLHESMGCICYENPGMGIYFIEDPDGYWMEVVPCK